MIKCILFDLDGVLVDACEWHYQALNRALEEVSDFKISRQEHITTYNGLPTKVKLQTLTDRGHILSEDRNKVWSRKQEITVEVINENAALDDQKCDMMKFIKSNNIKVGCVTNSIEKTANLMLEKTGQIGFMDIIVTNESVEKAKPSPEGYLLAMEKLNVSPKETLILEDSDKGFAAAISSNANVMRVSGPKEVNLKNIIHKISSIERGE